MGETPISSGGGTDAAVSAGPSTFAEAFATDASPASDTSAQTTTPADAEVPPPGAETTPAQDRSPFIPRPRFDEVNTRLKAAEEWKQQYAWAEQIPQQDLQQALDIARRASADPIAYVQELIADLQAHPQHGQALKSLAAKALSARSSGQPLALPEPDVAITDAQGNVVGHTYSDRQMQARDAYLMQQVLSKVDEKYAPVVKTHESVEQERAALKAKAEGQQFASGLIREMESRPRFKEFKAEIGAEVARLHEQYPANDPRTNSPEFLEMLTERAYNRIVVPKLQSTAESSVLDTLQRKAHASTSVNPGSAAPSAPRAINSFKDLPADMWK